MTADPTRATETVPGGDPQGTGTGATTDPNASETQEQEIARLKAALEQSKAEKSTLEETKRERDEANGRIAQLEAQAQPPMQMPPAGPVQALAQEIAQYEALVATEPGNFAAQRLLKNARAEWAGMQWQAAYQRESPKLDRLAEPLRSKATELFSTARYASADDAILAAEGFLAREGRNKSVAEEARRKAADEAAAKAAQSKPDTGGGSATEAAVSKRRVLTGTEFNRMTQTKSKEARQLISDLDNGKVEVDWAR